MRSIIQNKNGFTLIELVVSMVLVLFVLGAIAPIMISAFRTWDYGEEKIEVMENMRIGMDQMAEAIREATEITGCGSSYIEFTIPDEQLDGLIHIRYQYDSTDRELERKIGTDPPQPISSRIISVNFSYAGDPVNKVMIDLTGVRNDGYQINMKTSVILRAVSR